MKNFLVGVEFGDCVVFELGEGLVVGEVLGFDFGDCGM